MKTLRTLLLIIAIFNSYLVFAQQLFFERIFDETLAQASYVIADLNTKEAIVIDPKRDVDTYIDLVEKKGLKITHITETHIHADFLSGSRELSAATGAPLYLSDEGDEDWKYQFPHHPLKNNDQIKIGQFVLEIMHTPGHTPESLTFLLKDTKNKLNPVKAITGDFIFVGDVGRPDLLEKSAHIKDAQFIGAKQLFESLKQFSKLANNTEIWPGHGAGSFCGKSLSNIPQSTLLAEKQSNPAFRYLNNLNDFSAYILDGQPTPPKYFAVMKQLNKNNRSLIVQQPKYSLLTDKELLQGSKNNLTIIDTRSKDISAKAFIPNAINIENGKSFSTFVGSIVDYDKQIILIADASKIDDLTRKLIRIGMDNVYGYTDKIDAIPLQKAQLISKDRFKELLNDKNIQKIDVRTETEYANGHIEGVENIPLAQLEKSLNKIKKDQPIIIHCQSGTRAMIGYSYLLKQGFTNVLNYSGGINEWVETEENLTK